MKPRRLKVAPRYARLPPDLKITSSLHLCGDWLRNAGFVPGDVVSVEVTLGRLTITRA
ncbi:SymE family type I addiction module toxin [Hymenobacter antarcticus]|uniref:SymE family type I addiction module toxin n=1 Tax=Hymenobacter antarcticus TaxID=486270 RepID=UPI0031EE186D